MTVTQTDVEPRLPTPAHGFFWVAPRAALIWPAPGSHHHLYDLQTLAKGREIPDR